VKDGEAVGKLAKAPVPPAGKESLVIGYRLEVDGEKHDSFAGQIKVWGKKIKIEAKLPDGKPAAGAMMRILQEVPSELSGHDKANLLRKVGDDGKLDFKLVYPAPIQINWELPWVLVGGKWEKGEGPERSCQVKKMGWKPRVSFPGNRTAEDPHKQYVNLEPARNAPGNGPMLKVEVVAVPLEGTAWEGGYQPKAGEEVFLKAKFGDKNSKRTPPKNSKGPGETLEVKGKLSAVCTCTLEVPLTLAGGDTVEIKVGNSEECKDDTVHVAVWRRLEYELIQPKPDDLTGFTVFRDDKTLGLSDAMQTIIDKKLKGTGTEFKKASVGTFYSGSDLHHGGTYNIFDGKYFRVATGKKVVAIDESQYDDLQAKKGSSPQDKKTMQIIFADFYGDQSDVDVTIPIDALTLTQPIPSPSGVFRNTLKTGATGVKKISWKAVNYQKDGKWVPIAASTDPGWAHRAATDVPNNDANVDAWIKFDDYRSVTVNLPDSKPTDPGKLLTIDGVKVQLAVSITFIGSKFSANAAGWHGFIDMSTRATWATGGLMRTLLHELGHNMGLAYGSKTVDATYGRAAKYEIPGIPFPDGVPTGFVYGGHGHTGMHCAQGLTDDERKEASYGKLTGKCILFGQGDMSKDVTPDYCDLCTEHFRSTEADELTRHWETG
jgi:hypothetical protein